MINFLKKNKDKIIIFSLLIFIFTQKTSEIKVYTENENIIIERNFYIAQSHKIMQTVNITNYYVNDKYNSKIITSSGLTTDDFEINSLGWYTYKGHVVIATATNLCIRVTSGACGSFNSMLPTHHYLDLFQIVEIKFEDKSFSAIVLDSCGACNWDEDYQRIDIFISHPKHSFGKRKGAIIY